MGDNNPISVVWVSASTYVFLRSHRKDLHTYIAALMREVKFKEACGRACSLLLNFIQIHTKL